MDANDVRQLVDQGQLDQFDVSVHERDGRLVVNDLVALRVRCDVSIPRDRDFEVLAEDKTTLGALVLTSSRSDHHRNNKSDYVLAAYLTELDYADFDLTRRLNFDYLVLEKSDVDTYLQDYAPASAIWGGFVHVEADDVRLLRDNTVIEAAKGLRLPLDASEILCRRAVASAHPFERFLKHYHQLELLCDWYVARQIARLPNDLNGFEKIISSYSSGDFSRIKDLILAFCTDTVSVRTKIDNVQGFQSTAQEIFQEFGKSGNPLKDGLKWVQGRPKIQEKDVLVLAAYWIFRVRCSIAHHRVGEYLLTDADEEFVVAFAEPLLLEIVRQVLSSKKLHILV